MELKKTLPKFRTFHLGQFAFFKKSSPSPPLVPGMIGGWVQTRMLVAGTEYEGLKLGNLSGLASPIGFPWDGYIYLYIHLPQKSTIHAGKYTMTMDP